MPAGDPITKVSAMQPDSFRDIYLRVKDKKESYERYNFERLQEEAFATFFDLAQEYTSLEYLYQVCVAVPKVFFDLESRLYVLNMKSGRPEKVCTTDSGLIPLKDRVDESLELGEEPYQTKSAWVYPIRGNEALTRWIPFHSRGSILGAFVIYPKEKVDAQEHFFFEKFTNRIGYNLHQKLLIEQNINHIKFINQLVADIEHNVITPNIYYKLFLIRLNRIIQEYSQIQQQLRDLVLFPGRDHASLEEIRKLHRHLVKNTAKLREETNALSRHYEHTSLFLETLMRRDHFEKGTYVLRKQPCNFRTEIIQPLLDRYIPMFEKKGIVVHNMFEDVPDEEITLFVDKGLISQVFDNLFSNALKYTHRVEDQLGHRIKLVSYNREILANFFGENTSGVRFNFFTTGKPLTEQQAAKVFEEGYRTSSARQERGGGHGLHFVRNVVEIHGGIVGCEPQRYGNIFYFVLPLKDAAQVKTA